MTKPLRPGAQQPALYLSALDTLSAALNQLPVDTAQFRQFVANRQHPGQPYQQLEQALRALPLPPPRDLKATYVEQLDKEVEARNELLAGLKAQVTETEKALEARREELTAVSSEVEKLRAAIQAEREAIVEVSKAADSDMRTAWKEALETWTEERKKVDSENDAKTLESVATLAAICQHEAWLNHRLLRSTTTHSLSPRLLDLARGGGASIFMLTRRRHSTTGACTT